MNNKSEEMKRLIDRGWSEMSVQLDNKLPVNSNSKTKKFKYLILLLFLVSGIGLVSYNLMKSSNIISNPTKTKKDNQNIEHSKKMFFASNSSTLDKKSKSIIKSDNVNRNKENEITFEKKLSVENRDLSNSAEQNIDVANQVKESYIRTALDNKKNVLLENGKLTTKNNQKIDLYKGNSVEISMSNKILDNKSTFINNTESKEILFDKLKITTKPLFSYSSIKNKNIDYSALFDNQSTNCSNSFIELNLNFISENLNSFGGIETGALYKLGLNKNMGLVSGLDFSFLRKKGMSNSFLTSFNLVSDETLRGVSEVENNEQFNNNFRSPFLMGNFVKDLYYIGIPISFYYSNNRFSVSAGMKLSYMFLATNYSSNKNSIGGQNVVIYSKKAFYNSDILNIIDYGVVFNFDYFITRQLGITTKFNYSFNGIIKDPGEQLNPRRKQIFAYRVDQQYKDRFDKNIYFSLGIKYRILKRCH